MTLLDQDGEAPTDAERARRRHLILGKQGADGMSEIRGLLDPEARATLDAVLAKLAVPGMCNPENDTPCVDGPASQTAIQGDARSQPQRNHDALKAMSRSVLASGELGQHNGLPCHRDCVHHPQRIGVGVRAGGHRRRHAVADVRCDPAGQPRVSLSGDLRPAQRDPAVPAGQLTKNQQAFDQQGDHHMTTTDRDGITAAMYLRPVLGP